MQTKIIPGGITAAKGFKASGVHAGIRKNKDKLDLALIVSDTPASAAAVYTTNKVQGAPIALTKQHLADGIAQAIVCNSGNANTCAPSGPQLAADTAALVAEATGVKTEDVVVASTGVIGQPMPLDPFAKGIPAAFAQLSAEGGTEAAKAIMTTDTKPKEIALEFEVGGVPCHLGAIGKGSGMIAPNMATMLIFMTSDVAITPTLLAKALKEEIPHSLNQIYIDGDTSTNDMAVLLCNGRAGNVVIDSENEAYATFCEALHAVCVWMCRAIAKDGEGATKLLECHVTGAPTTEVALAVAKSVIASDLLKAAMFGQDANWGRILCAIGYTPGDFSVDKVSVTLKSNNGQVLVCENCAYHDFSEDDAYLVLKAPEIEILVDMNDGNATGSAWGCDLTYNYVKINGDYRT